MSAPDAYTASIRNEYDAKRHQLEERKRADLATHEDALGALMDHLTQVNHEVEILAMQLNLIETTRAEFVDASGFPELRDPLAFAASLQRAQASESTTIDTTDIYVYALVRKQNESPTHLATTRGDWLRILAMSNDPTVPWKAEHCLTSNAKGTVLPANITILPYLGTLRRRFEQGMDRLRDEFIYARILWMNARAEVVESDGTVVKVSADMAQRLEAKIISDVEHLDNLLARIGKFKVEQYVDLLAGQAALRDLHDRLVQDQLVLLDRKTQLSTSWMDQADRWAQKEQKLNQDEQRALQSKRGTLVAACESGDMQQVRNVVETLDDPDPTDPSLMERALEGLGAGKGIKRKRIVNRLHAAGHAPLHIACHLGDAAMVRYLLEAGAQPLLPDTVHHSDEVATNGAHHGNTPVHYAARSGHLDLCQLLLAFWVHGKAALATDFVAPPANSKRSKDALRHKSIQLLNVTGHYHQTPLHCAVRHQHPAVVDFFLAAGADPNAVEQSQGATPLHVAAQLGDIALSRALLAAGANPRAYNHNHEIPLAVSLFYVRPALARFYMDQGIWLPVEERDALLQFAQKHNHDAIVLGLKSVLDAQVKRVASPMAKLWVQSHAKGTRRPTEAHDRATHMARERENLTAWSSRVDEEAGTLPSTTTKSVAVAHPILRELFARITALWDRFAVPPEDRAAFNAFHAAQVNRDAEKSTPSVRVVKQYQAEEARLSSRIQEAVEARRAELRALWDELRVPERERVKFTWGFAARFTQDALEAHDAECARLAAQLEVSRPVLALVAKHERLKESKADDTALDAMESDLRSAIGALETAEGPFVVDGVRYLSTLGQRANGDAKRARSRRKMGKKDGALLQRLRRGGVSAVLKDEDEVSDEDEEEHGADQEEDTSGSDSV